MSLPSVTTICLRKVGHSETSWQISNTRWTINPQQIPIDPTQSINILPVASLNIKHLELRDCAFTSQAFSSLLNAFKGLECFIYEADALSSDDYGIPLSFFHECMLRHKHSLERLWLGYTPKPSYCNDDGYPYLGLQQSFGMFTKLKHLRVPIALILNAILGLPSEPHKRTGNSFPDSIEIIHLSNCNREQGERSALRLIQCILLDKKNGFLPAVNQIKITVPRPKHAEGIAKSIGGTEDIIVLATALKTAIIIETYSGWERERKWGMCEDISRPPCSDRLFRREAASTYSLKQMVSLHEAIINV